MLFARCFQLLNGRGKAHTHNKHDTLLIAYERSTPLHHAIFIGEDNRAKKEPDEARL
jgi:hypothetical protein